MATHAATVTEAPARRYRLLLDLARDVTAQRDLAAVLEATFMALRQVLGFGGGSIALVEEDYIRFAATDPPATPEALTMRIPLGEGIAGTIAVTGEPVYIPDIHVDPRVTPERRAKSVSSGVVSYFGVPLITEGHPIGVLQIDHSETDGFTEDDRLVLLSFTPIVAAAVQNARVYGREVAALERLQELDQRHRDFVALVSHELRTPLTAVMGYADTILAHYDQLGMDGVLPIVERARSSATRLATMVEELLDLSVIQRGELRLAFAPTDVPAVLAEAVAQFAPAGRDVTIGVPDGMAEVLTDADRLTQIVGNLISNAAKFSPADAPVRVGARFDGGELVVSVEDRGIGIPSADRQRIFERFVQLERANTRRIGGFGVGLYVVRELCEALGGRVEVESQVGAGSTFRVRLPRQPPLDVLAQRD